MLQLVVQLAEGDEVAQAVVVVYAPVALVNLVVRVGGGAPASLPRFYANFLLAAPLTPRPKLFLALLPIHSVADMSAIGRTVRPGINKSA